MTPYGEYLRKVQILFVVQLLSNKRIHYSFRDVRVEKFSDQGVDNFLEVVIQEHENRMSNNSQVEDHKDFIDFLLWLQKKNILNFPIDKASFAAIFRFNFLLFLGKVAAVFQFIFLLFFDKFTAVFGLYFLLF